MNTELFKGEKLYSSGDFKLCRESYAAINVAIGDNQAVGIIAGYYDEDLTIAYVSEFFLHNLGYSYEEFMEAVAGSLKNVFCGENDGFIRNERLVKIHGSEDVKMLNKEGAPVKIRAYKQIPLIMREHRSGFCLLILMRCRKTCSWSTRS